MGRKYCPFNMSYPRRQEVRVVTNPQRTLPFRFRALCCHSTAVKTSSGFFNISFCTFVALLLVGGRTEWGGSSTKMALNKWEQDDKTGRQRSKIYNTRDTGDHHLPQVHLQVKQNTTASKSPPPKST